MLSLTCVGKLHELSASANSEVRWKTSSEATSSKAPVADIYNVYIKSERASSSFRTSRSPSSSLGAL